MKNCPSCHAQFPDAVSFCKYCGSHLGASQTEQPSLDPASAAKPVAPIDQTPAKAPVRSGTEGRALHDYGYGYAPSPQKGPLTRTRTVIGLFILLAAALLYFAKTDAGRTPLGSQNPTPSMPPPTLTELRDSPKDSIQPRPPESGSGQTPGIQEQRALSRPVGRSPLQKRTGLEDAQSRRTTKDQETITGGPASPEPGRFAMLEFREDKFEVRTLSLLSASSSRPRDIFQAQIVIPRNVRGALIEGHVVKSKASGKIKGKSELLFSFDRLVLKDGTSIPISARLEGVRNSRGDQGVDDEGRVLARSSAWKDVAKTGVISAIGAGLGGILGGKKGAAIGAGAGAGMGLTLTFSARGEDVILAPGSVFVLLVSTREGEHQQ